MKAFSKFNGVWVGRCTEESAAASFATALEHSPLPETGNIRSIVIKINICDYRRAESGAVTDPELLGALVEALRGRYPAADFHVVENDATSLDICSAYRLLGFTEAARRYGFTLHNVAEDDWVSLPVPQSRVFETLEVPRMVHTAGLFVNFAKLKTNALTKFTGCLKNIFALLRTKRKVVWHGRIDDVLLDMNRVIHPGFCVIDGVIGMEGIGGPAFGRPKRCDLIVAGVNPVSVDSCAARIMGFRPASIKHIRLCKAAGLGSDRFRMETDIEGFDYRDYRFRFENLEYTLKNIFRSRAGVAA